MQMRIVIICIDAEHSLEAMTTLADLDPGQTVRIIRVRYADPRIQRLMVLGLVEDAELSFVGSSLGGDPLEFRLFGSAVSLRRDQAVDFDVELI